MESPSIVTTESPLAFTSSLFAITSPFTVTLLLSLVKIPYAPLFSALIAPLTVTLVFEPLTSSAYKLPVDAVNSIPLIL